MKDSEELNLPDRIIIDLREVIKDLSEIQSHYVVYKEFSLKDIIAELLLCNPYIDYSENIWYALEKRVGNRIDLLDLEEVDRLFQIIVLLVDATIQNKLPKRIDTGEYIFDKWVSNTAVMLIKQSIIPNLMRST